jgi:type II secretory ATPase GspE/PulE/Tfp pilus assembly ATPase PilB-like protein
MFLGWLPIVNWVNTDAQAVRTKVKFWTIIVAVTGAISLVVLLMVPMFLVGLLVYIIALGACVMAYIIHRNSMVADFERVFTIGSMKSAFVNQDKKTAKLSKGIVFVTANKNDVPLPKAKSPELLGFSVLCDIIDDSLWRRTSDIVFKPQGQEYSVTYKIDGVACKQSPRSKEEIEYALQFIKQVADLDIQEKRKPQTGQFWTTKDSVKTSWDVTTAGSTAGEQFIITKSEQYLAMKLDDIGLNPKQLEALKTIRNIPSGTVIISGPPKSGVTTTFYSMIRNHDPFMNGINTLEKKLSATLDNITQHIYELGDTGAKSYSETLRRILRMGPDIVAVEGCQDADLGKLTANAANDGKIMHVTMNTSGVLQAVGLWIKQVGDRNLAADTLAAVINQRLVRKLCDECKQAYKPNADLLRKFNIPANKEVIFYRTGEIEYDKHGKPLLCEKCQGTGFYGRTAIFECIVLDDKLRQAIKQAKSMQEIGSHFRRAGMLYIQEESIKRVAKGITAINEVIRELSSNDKATKGGKK